MLLLDSDLFAHYYLPNSGANIFILLSFWCSDYARATLNLLGTFVTAIMFIAFAEYAPFAYVPRLVHYYEATLILSWLVFVVFVVNCCLQKYSHKYSAPCDLVLEIMNISWIRTLLGIDLVLVERAAAASLLRPHFLTIFYFFFSSHLDSACNEPINHGMMFVNSSIELRLSFIWCCSLWP